MRTKTTTNPAFYADQLRLILADEPERLEAALTDPTSLDLVTWNLFASLDTHQDPDYLAYRFQPFGGTALRAPARIALWTGKRRGPRLRPSRGYVTTVRERARSAGGDATSTQAFEAPVEVPVRIESPDVLVLIETMGRDYPRGVGGRDRIVELVDAGLEHARRLTKTLAVALVYRSGSNAAAEASARMLALRDPATLAAELPHRHSVPPVVLREMPWQQLARIWEQEVPYLDLAGQPVRPFIELLRERDLL